MIRSLPWLVAILLLPAVRAQAPLDRWGDPLPPEALQRLGTTHEQDALAIAAAAWSPDGKRLALAYYSPCRVKLWDPMTRSVASSFSIGAAASDAITAMAFAPDGGQLIVATREGVRSFDPGSGAPRHTFASAPFVGHLAVSSTGLLAFGGQGRLWLHELSSGACRRELQQPAPLGDAYCLVRFSPDGAHLAALDVNRATLTLFDVSSGAARWSVQAGAGDPTAFSAANLLFSPNGDHVVASSRGVIRAWDTARGGHAWSWRPTGAEEGRDYALAFTPDGASLVLSASTGAVRLFDAVTRVEQRALPLPIGPGPRLDTLAFSPDGRLLSGSGTLCLIEVATGRLLAPAPRHASVIQHLAFSSDGTRLFSASDESVIVWDVASSRDVGWFARAQDERGPLAPSRDLTRVALAAGDKVRVREAATGAELSTLVALPRAVEEGGTPRVGFESLAATALAFSPDGKQLLAGYGGGSVHLWDLTRAKAERLRTQRGAFGVGEPLFVWFTRGGGFAALFDTPEVDLATWSKRKAPVGRTELIHVPEGISMSDPLHGFAASWEGNLVAISQGKHALLTGPRGAAPARMEVTAKENARVSLALSREGQVLASAGDWEKNLRVWKTGARHPQWELNLEPFAGWATALAISPDDRLLAVATRQDDCVYVFPLERAAKRE